MRRGCCVLRKLLGVFGILLMTIGLPFVVMATHDNNIVDAMRRRVIELDFGKVVRDQARGVYGVGR